MGLKRMLWRSIPIGRNIDTIFNIVEEGSVRKGIKRTLKEDICEDNPITSTVYKAGQLDGRKEGYVEASAKYEEKLIQQANEFLQQKQITENQIKEYEKLLDDYEREIEGLNEKAELTEEENKYLHQLLIKERQLRKLKVS